jgi:F-type H+-transporting ATPase subunit delta
MIGQTIVAKRYAKALFLLAKEQDVVTEIEQQLQTTFGALDEKVYAFLGHPQIALSVKLRIINHVFEGRTHSLVLHIVLLLVARGRVQLLPDVYEAYRHIADKNIGRSRIHITSAFELSRAQQQEIVDAFALRTKQEVSASTTVDPTLLGGIRVRMHDQLYDGSLVTKLKHLQQQFT